MARLPDLRDDGFPLGKALLLVIAGLMLVYMGGVLQKATNPPKPCPSPTPCACEQPWIVPPKMPIYSPEPGIETWSSLNREHPASEPLR